MASLNPSYVFLWLSFVTAAVLVSPWFLVGAFALVLIGGTVK